MKKTALSLKIFLSILFLSPALASDDIKWSDMDFKDRPVLMPIGEKKLVPYTLKVRRSLAERNFLVVSVKATEEIRLKISGKTNVIPADTPFPLYLTTGNKPLNQHLEDTQLMLPNSLPAVFEKTSEKTCGFKDLFEAYLSNRDLNREKNDRPDIKDKDMVYWFKAYDAVPYL